jgi:hypothetical protein
MIIQLLVSLLLRLRRHASALAARIHTVSNTHTSYHSIIFLHTHMLKCTRTRAHAKTQIHSHTHTPNDTLIHKISHLPHPHLSPRYILKSIAKLNFDMRIHLMDVWMIYIGTNRSDTFSSVQTCHYLASLSALCQSCRLCLMRVHPPCQNPDILPTKSNCHTGL